MIDLHLFLGRRPATSLQATTTSEGPESAKNRKPDISYCLSDMTPDMVHFGSVPESIMTPLVEQVNRLSNNIQSLRNVCENAMKQYRRTRPLASKSAVQRSKAILDGQIVTDKTDTGLVFAGAIPIHPIFVHELQNSVSTESVSPHALNSRANVQDREEFLRSLSQFRPKESVFEAFATGGGRQVGVLSQVDKGRTTSDSKKKNDTSAALTAMKNMRRQMRMVRDKELVVAGTETAQQESDTEGERAMEDTDEPDMHTKVASDAKNDSPPSDRTSELVETPTVPTTGKRRMSKAERKRMKKEPKTSLSGTNNAFQISAESSSKKKKDMRSSDFRDPSFFIENDFTSNREEANRSRQIEAAMQPSNSSSNHGGSSMIGAAARLEEAMLDIVGDENEELVQRQRMMRWDKSKRKYVQTTVGAELSGDSKSKRMRLESGQMVKNDKLKLGELYEKWQKKTNRSIGRNGVFDDVEGVNLPSSPAYDGSSRRNKKHKNAHSSGARPDTGDDGRKKTAVQIKKERAKNLDNKIKNMKKSDRKALEQKQKSAKPKASFNNGKDNKHSLSRKRK